MRHVALLPIVCYVVILGYACYGWMTSGQWPYYAHPDPKELPHRALLHIASAAFLIGALSVILIPVGYSGRRAVASWRRRPVELRRNALLCYVAGLALWVFDLIPEFTDAPWSSNISWLLD